MNNLFILSFANVKNTFHDNFKKSLDKFNYDYKIIGEGVEWKNFMTKTKNCYNWIKDNYNGVLNNYNIICIVDCYDVLFTSPKEEMLQKFLKYNKEIVVGAENYVPFSSFPKCEKWFEYNSLNIKKSTYKNINAGCIIGYKDAIIDLYKYILDMNIEDDQIALVNFTNTYPDRVGVDTQSMIVGNLQLTSYLHYSWKNGRFYNKKTGSYPCVFHRPCIQFDLYLMYEKFGKKILKNSFVSVDRGQKLWKNKIFKIYILVLFLIIFMLVIIKYVRNK